MAWFAMPTPGAAVGPIAWLYAGRLPPPGGTTDLRFPLEEGAFAVIQGANR